MSLSRARIVKGLGSAESSSSTATARMAERAGMLARRVPAPVLDARLEAARILDDARDEARAIATRALEAAAATAREAAEQARAEAAARAAADYLSFRAIEDRRTERDVDRIVSLAVLLAERVVRESLEVEPLRIAKIAEEAIREARGARRVRLLVSPDDARALSDPAVTLGESVEVVADPELSRGSIVVETELGRIDARLQVFLERLAVTVRESLGREEDSP